MTDIKGQEIAIEDFTVNNDYPNNISDRLIQKNLRRFGQH